MKTRVTSLKCSFKMSNVLNLLRAFFWNRISSSRIDLHILWAIRHQATYFRFPDCFIQNLRCSDTVLVSVIVAPIPDLHCAQPSFTFVDCCRCQQCFILYFKYSCQQCFILCLRRSYNVHEQLRYTTNILDFVSGFKKWTILYRNLLVTVVMFVGIPFKWLQSARAAM